MGRIKSIALFVIAGLAIGSILAWILHSNRYRYTLVAEWGGFGYADEDGKFQLPYGSFIYQDHKGQELLLISDCHNNTVQTFDLAGNFVSRFGQGGNEAGSLKAPADIAVDKAGYIWVAEEDNDWISKFDSDGNFIDTFIIAADFETDNRSDTFNLVWKPLGVAFDSTNSVYISNYGNNLVLKFDAEGGPRILNRHESLLTASDLAKAAQKGTGDSEFDDPYYLAIDSKDNLYVVDRGNNRVQKFDPDGEFLLRWGRNGGDGTPGDGEGEFDYPHEIAIDRYDNVYVADTKNKRVQVFDSKGKFLFALGGEGVFVAPKVVAVDSESHIYVGDAGHRALEEEGEAHDHEAGLDDIRITKWARAFRF